MGCFRTLNVDCWSINPPPLPSNRHFHPEAFAAAPHPSDSSQAVLFAWSRLRTGNVMAMRFRARAVTSYHRPQSTRKNSSKTHCNVPRTRVFLESIDTSKKILMGAPPSQDSSPGMNGSCSLRPLTNLHPIGLESWEWAQDTPQGPGTS